MSLDEVAKKVIEKGQRESNMIVKQGGQETLQIIKKAENDAKVLVSQARERAEKQIKLNKEQEMSSAEVEGRRNRLTAEKQILDEVKEKTFQDLIAASTPKKEQILNGLIKQAAQIIPSGSVYSNDEDSAAVKKMASQYKFAGTIKCSGGIIIESSDRTQRLNLTYEMLLEELWTENIGQVADILFK